VFCFKVNELFKNWVLKFEEEGSPVLVSQRLAAVVVAWDDLPAAANTVSSTCKAAEYPSRVFAICFKALVRQVPK